MYAYVGVCQWCMHALPDVDPEALWRPTVIYWNYMQCNTWEPGVEAYANCVSVPVSSYAEIACIHKHQLAIGMQ